MKNKITINNIYKQAKVHWPKFSIQFTDFEQKVYEADIAIQKVAYKDLYLAIAVCKRVNVAWEQFYFIYESHIKKKINYSLWSKSDIENDIFQDLMEKLPDKLCTFKGKALLYGWLIAVTRNFVKSYFKKKHINTIDIDENEQQYKDDQIEQIMLKKCTKLFKKILPKAISELKSDEQVIIMLKYEDNLKNKEIAKIFKIKEPALCKKLKKIKEKMKKKLLNIALQEVIKGRQDLNDCLEFFFNDSDITVDFT